VRIYADGTHVVARDGRAVWRPESGQIVFAFAVDELVQRARRVLPVPAAAHGQRVPSAPPQAADGAWAWFEHGLAREEADDLSGARAAYERAIEADPDLEDAYVNLGRLVHEAGELGTALRLYACAVDRAPIDPVAHYNLALALEDAQRFTEAVAHYEHALRCDPRFADAHFNLSRLLDRLGHRKRALRHLLAYQRLTKGRSS
jgi:tetratricopeptide (TPR) repeat protein